MGESEKNGWGEGGREGGSLGRGCEEEVGGGGAVVEEGGQGREEEGKRDGKEGTGKVCTATLENKRKEGVCGSERKGDGVFVHFGGENGDEATAASGKHEIR